MSGEAAHGFLSELNASEDLRREVLDQARLDLLEVAQDLGFDCTAAELRQAAAGMLGGNTATWLGRTVEWRPEVGGGTLAVLPVEGLDLRLTQGELDLMSAGCISTCEEPNCNHQESV